MDVLITLSVLQQSSDLQNKQESRRRAKRKAWKESRQGQTSVRNGEFACTEVHCAGIALDLVVCKAGSFDVMNGLVGGWSDELI